MGTFRAGGAKVRKSFFQRSFFHTNFWRPVEMRALSGLWAIKGAALGRAKRPTNGFA
jgi:hypothetical protein